MKAQEMMLKYHMQDHGEFETDKVVIRECGFSARLREQELITIVSKNFRTKGYVARRMMLSTPAEVQKVYDSLKLYPGRPHGRMSVQTDGDYYESGREFGKTIMNKRSLDVRRPMLEKHE